jgi:cell division protein ZapA
MSNLVQTRVAILGRDFVISTPESEQDTLQQALLLLISKVESIQATGMMDTQKIAIMAALNLASDFLKMNLGDSVGDSDWSLSKITSRLDQMNALIESQLDASSTTN